VPITCAQGYLLPYFHTSYWIGLVLDLWPSFKWIDPSMPLVTPPYYNNWGNYTGGARSAGCGARQACPT
jgi:hypothetical protein